MFRVPGCSNTVGAPYTRSIIAYMTLQQSQHTFSSSDLCSVDQFVSLLCLAPWRPVCRFVEPLAYLLIYLLSDH